MTEYTPTTGDVRAAYTRAMRQAFITSTGEHIAEFDRWLAQVRAEAQVEALREVAAEFVAPVLRLTESAPIPLHAVAGRLRDRADRIAREAGIETGESDE